MKPRFAIIGFQHPHVWDLVARAKACPEIEGVACCEEDAATRAALADGDGQVRFGVVTYGYQDIPVDARAC
jgi:hypothetical protein